MFAVMNRVPVAAGWEDAFEERFRRRAGQVESNPGFIRMQIMRPITAGAPYIVNTVWESKAAFEAWIDSEDFKAAHSNPLPKEAYNGESKMEQYDLVITAETPSP